MREAQGVIITTPPPSHPIASSPYILFVTVVSNVKFMLLVFICGELLVRNSDQHANRKIGSDAAVCPEETSLLL